MDCIYIAPLSKALYNLCLSFIHPFTHTFTHQRRLAAMQGTNQLVRSNWGLGVLLWDTSTRPGWDRTGNPPTARRLLLPPELYRPILIIIICNIYIAPYRPRQSGSAPRHSPCGPRGWWGSSWAWCWCWGAGSPTTCRGALGSMSRQSERVWFGSRR